MAEVTYELIVKSDDLAGGTSGNRPQQNNAMSAKTVYKNMAKAWNGIALVRSMAEWTTSLITRSTGNSTYQARIDAVTTIAKQGAGIVGSFVLGGPIAGLAAMATVGLSYAKEVEQSNYARKWEDISLTQTRLRAGASFNRSRN